MKTKEMKKHWMRLLIAGTLSVGFVGTMPAALRAADDEKKEGNDKIPEAKVPPAVVATAKQNYFDATNIAYRRGEGKDKDIYHVNFVTPEKVRLQVLIDDTGKLVGGIRQAPNQPEGAPKGEERERVAAAWLDRATRAQVAAATPNRLPIPAQGTNTPLALPPNQSPAVGGGEVEWASLPEQVRRTLQPLTGKDRNAKFFRQSDGRHVSYGSTYRDDGNDMWVRLDEAGQIVVQPTSAKTGRPINDREPEQASSKLSAAMMKDKVNFAELPKAVQSKVLKQTEGSKDVTNMRHEEGKKTVYHTSWVDNKGDRHDAFYNEAGESVSAPKSMDR